MVEEAGEERKQRVRGKRKSPQVLDHAFTCSLYKWLSRLSVSGSGLDTWDSERMWPGAPLLVGKADGEQACIVPVRAAMGPAWLTGGVSARGWMVSNSSSVVRLE